ncbi:unnamed protein product, partial [Timema podura]|nr:unnamed protein product [Timema podura]
DEADTSNSVDEIVKTEIMLYDSSLGIMDSNMDLIAPVDQSEEKIVELIKTEPQNEDEFDMCGLSRVKTEVRYQIFLDYEN